MSRALVINEDVGLRKEGLETIGNSQLFCALARILRAPCTPAIQNRILSTEFADMLNN